MLWKKLMIASLVAGCAQVASPQMHGGGHAAGFRSGMPITGRHPRYDGAFFHGYPYLFADYPSESFDSMPPPPQVVVVRPTPSGDAPLETKAEPLLIELRGDHYVRIGGLASQPESGLAPDYAGTGAPRSSAVAAQAQAFAGNQVVRLLPAVLIYRDGHKEQVTDYAIVEGVMYARGNYWQNGYWTKPIPLSALNIPATIQANQEQGVKFVLPSGPNEVVTRP